MALRVRGLCHLPFALAKALRPVRVALALENLWPYPATQAFCKLLALLDLCPSPAKTWVGRHALALVLELLRTAAARQMQRTSLRT